MLPLHSKRLRRLSREGLWVVVGQAAAVLGGLAGVRLLTELLDPAAYGELALGLTVATLIHQTVLGPLGSGLTRYYAPAVERGELGGYLRATRELVLSATGVVALLIPLAVILLVLTGRQAWIPIAVAALVYALLSGQNSILSGIQNAARQRSIVALHQGVEPWARFGIAAALLWWLGARSAVAMLGYAVAAFLVLGSQFLFFRRTVLRSPAGACADGSWRERIWKYSWPMAVTGVTSWGFFASQRWALELFASTADVGYFSAVFQIGFTPFSLAGGALLSLFMPIVFGRAGDGEDQRRVALVSGSILRFCLAASSFVLLSTAIAAVFHDAIFRVLVAGEYREISRYLPLAVLAGGIFQVSLLLSTIVLASTRTRLLMPLNTIGNSTAVVLNLFFTQRFGMRGLLAAMVIGSAVHLAWNICNVRQVLRHA
jgi:O-antigen/teichoic acid export membrane protein